ncbi:hypothetical protein TRFO_24530 [Tritrichomonas foetus]|uniref:C2H2-type domain-containing protein n=1 Tax=Tritrichomonas foetus TaxID=1144522 RepID=A0A1J4K7I7_9EUKA|nr:hypothetical protein TRFO_24530 [Tritrichomonas foetus]|eukprot:OHT07343.1 hypothetical protein TRFO_24530 [Tritrichomonas foetus]
MTENDNDNEEECLATLTKDILTKIVAKHPPQEVKSKDNESSHNLPLSPVETPQHILINNNEINSDDLESLERSSFPSEDFQNSDSSNLFPNRSSSSSDDHNESNLDNNDDYFDDYFVRKRYIDDMIDCRNREDLITLINKWSIYQTFDVSLDDDILEAMIKSHSLVRAVLYACPFPNCLVIFTTSSQIKRHIEQSHDGTDQNMFVEIVSKTINYDLQYSCDDIDISPYFCLLDKCGCIFESLKSLKYHYSDCHRELKLLTQNYGWFWAQINDNADKFENNPSLSYFINPTKIYIYKDSIMLQFINHSNYYILIINERNFTYFN